MATEAPPRPREREKGPGDGAGYGAPCHVIVMNDNHNSFEHVASALASVIPGVDHERGMALANKIHSSGEARVWSGSREQGELYWEQLKAAGLTMAPLG